jgi:drug/metabolite transporter (DMT)-like permease
MFISGESFLHPISEEFAENKEREHDTEFFTLETNIQKSEYSLQFSNYLYLIVSAVSILAYLLLWVANAEMMQGIANGTMAPEAFDRPAFLSWFSYNFMLLSWIPLFGYCRNCRKCSVIEFLQSTWAGSSGLGYMVLCSSGMQLLLLALNILWIIGLDYISVALSNAVYQLQAAVTVGLMVWCLGTKFTYSEAIGIAISLLGVALIVIPPLLDSGDNEEEPSARVLYGIIATLISAIVWAFYQISWKIISIDKPELTKLDGLLDTAATLGVMGLCNLFLGWPVLTILHFIGLEVFELPSRALIPALACNALVEYAFDASLAIAIFFTSPVITAITAPLTIPISLIVDHYLHGSPFQVGNFDWIGLLLVLVGVAGMELKLSLPLLSSKKIEKHDYIEMPEAFASSESGWLDNTLPGNGFKVLQ